MPWGKGPFYFLTSDTGRNPLDWRRERKFKHCCLAPTLGGGGRWQAGSPKPTLTSVWTLVTTTSLDRRALGGTSRGQVGMISNKAGHGHGLDFQKTHPPSAGHLGIWTNCLERESSSPKWVRVTPHSEERLVIKVVKYFANKRKKKQQWL